jgi:hypothetical protein
MAQRYNIDLNGLIQKIGLFIDFLTLLRCMMQTLELLYRKYGGFKVTEKMIGSSHNGSIMMWIHENNY